MFWNKKEYKKRHFVYFIFGVSGAGKSTIKKELEILVQRDRRKIDVIEFDHYGVPKDMPEFAEWVQWRQDRTELILSKAKRDTVVCGTVLPNEFYQWVDYRDKFVSKFCLLTLKKRQIKKRLKKRNWSKELINQNVELDKHLRWLMTREFDGLVIDTSKLDITESANKIYDWIIY